jgi:Mrp family chromosome partitioning ATPase
MKKYSDLQGNDASKISEQVAEKASALACRMENISRKIAIVSGKGGVGKSVVTALFAKYLVSTGATVGVLDADINGSSISNLLGATQNAVQKTDNGYKPAADKNGIFVMSVDYLLDVHKSFTGNTPTWLGAMETNVVRELLADTDWGSLDYLLIDTPPILSRVGDIKDLLTELDGAVVVTTASKVSIKIMLKTLLKLAEMKVNVLGVIENMKELKCEHCGHKNDLFIGENVGKAVGYLAPYLGALPFVPNLEKVAIDELRDVFISAVDNNN